MKSFRNRRVGELLRRELAESLNHFKDETSGYLITVTEVKTSKDLKTADIWVSIYGNHDKRQQGMRILQDNSWKIRMDVAQRVHLRRMPEFSFKLDETLDEAEKIDRILKDSGFDLDFNLTAQQDD